MDMPFKRIGEAGWDDNLSSYLHSMEIELEPVEDINIKKAEERLDCIFPESIHHYFNKIGICDSADFMPNLYCLDSFINLLDSEWRKIINSFDEDDLINYVVFAESVDGEPVCFEKDSGGIYMFTSSPAEKGMIFTDFSDYLLNELINLKYASEISEMSETEEFEFKEEIFENNSLIDENMRIVFLFGGYGSDNDDDDDDDFDDDYDEDDIDFDDDYYDE